MPDSRDPCQVPTYCTSSHFRLQDIRVHYTVNSPTVDGVVSSGVGHFVGCKLLPLCSPGCSSGRLSVRFLFLICPDWSLPILTKKTSGQPLLLTGFCSPEVLILSSSLDEP